MVHARNAIAEANAALGNGLGGRVLEPSPPAIDDGEYYADDPVATDVAAERIVSPVDGDLSWADVVAERPDLAAWAAERWLGGPRRLLPIPDGLAEARTALHRLATYVIAPARHRVTGKFGLRWTKGGFGTPFFGDDVQIRVEGDQLIVQEGDSARATTITSLAAGAEFIGSDIDGETAAEHDSPPVGDVDADLGVRAEVTEFLSSWWGMGTAALEILRADAASVDPSRVQMWPGHFDPAIEVGDEDRRASYGASPGDGGSIEPYLYISVWWPDRLELDSDDPFWNAEGFTGALLGYGEIAVADDPVAAAVEFFMNGRDRLLAAAGS
ncbi:MAG: hypothetical protein OEV40_10340 [Acidimicrobiia bacterium]|nr:hypothetical protein [Acidimicrobiia bacterium]